MKACTKCKIQKELSEFSKHNTSKDGVRTACKLCSNKQERERTKIDPAKQRESQEKHKGKLRNANRDHIMKYLSTHPCIDCGNTNPIVLEFDHRSNKHKNVSELISEASRERLQQEIDKCDIRCANCHRIKTAKENNSYRLK